MPLVISPWPPKKPWPNRIGWPPAKPSRTAGVTTARNGKVTVPFSRTLPSSPRASRVPAAGVALHHARAGDGALHLQPLAWAGVLAHQLDGDDGGRAGELLEHQRAHLHVDAGGEVPDQLRLRPVDAGGLQHRVDVVGVALGKRRQRLVGGDVDAVAQPAVALGGGDGFAAGVLQVAQHDDVAVVLGEEHRDVADDAEVRSW